MDSNRKNEVVARVVAWHNRHPLARRITAAQVNSVGVVALPFVTTAEGSKKQLRADLIAPREVVEPGFAPPTLDEVVEPVAIETEPATKASLPEQAMARAAKADGAASAAAASPQAPTFTAPGRPWIRLDPRRWLRPLIRLIWPGSRAGFQSVFSEDFIAPLSPKKVALWALKYGNTTQPGDPDWPLREIAPDAEMQSRALAAPGVEPVTLFLTAAAVDAPTGRLRVLLGRSGQGSAPHVIGPRDLSPVRKAVAGALATVTLALAGWGGYWYSQQVPPPEAVTSSANAHADAASQAASVPAPKLAQITAAPASAAVAARAASLAAAAKPVQSAPSAPIAAAATALAPAVAPPPPTKAARIRPAPAPKLPAASSSPAHSLALEQHPSLYEAPKTINEMAIALHNKSWIPEGVKQAALLEGKRLRALAAEAAAHPKPAPPPASAPDDAPDAHAMPGLAADKSASRSEPAIAAKAATPGASAEPQYYALVTKPSTSKVEAEARMIMLRAAAANAIAPRGTRIELLQTQNTWQAVWWPFVKREDAERARHLLMVRGVLVEMVAF